MDNVFFTRFAREDDSSSEIDAAIKFHSVTSHSIVLPVDQLRFPASRQLLNAQPRLISDGVISFVIGSDKAGIAEYIRERISEIDTAGMDVIHAIESTPGALRTYAQPDTMLTFNDLFWQQIRNPNSFVRRYGVLTQADCDALGAEYEGSGIKGRRLYECIDATFREEKRQFLRDLAEYIYLYAGAKHSGCRLILPQQELIDWSDATFVPTERYLSEQGLFFDVLVESILLLGDDLSDLDHMGLVTDTNFSRLTYNDVFALREGINFSSFLGRYLEIINKCDALSKSFDDGEVLRDIDHILRLREDLVRTFNEEAAQDVTAYRMLKGAEGFVAFFGSVLGLSYGVRALLNSFAVVMKREKEYKAWQERRLKRLRHATSWGRDRLTGGNVIPYLLDVERRIVDRLARK